MHLKQTLKYSAWIGLSIIILVGAFYIIRSWPGLFSNTCEEPVQTFTDDNGIVGLKKCEDIILAPTYDAIADFSEGLAVVKEDSIYGFIDEKGTLVIEIKYEKSEGFSGGKALIQLNGQEYYINKTGECIEQCPPNEDEVWATTNHTPTIDSYRDYLKYFPNGKYSEEAQNAINNLENEAQIDREKEAWKRTTGANDIKAYQQYQKDYPNGMYLKEAKEKIRTLNAPNSITDKRSGYKTVNLNGKTWLAENLNLKVTDSWCYDDKDENCDKYGRLYTWDAAQNACSILGTEWRLPTDTEWSRLLEEYNYNTLISGGSSSFDALLGGYRFFLNKEFHNLESKGDYWCATKIDPNWCLFYKFDKDLNKFHRTSGAKSNAFSCRCIKD